MEPYLDVLPVGSSPGVEEVAVDVVLLVAEVVLGGQVDHPGTPVATHPQVQGVEARPIKVGLPVEGTLATRVSCR